MVSWIFVILVLAALIIFFKTTGVRFGKTWTFLIGFVILFFVLSFGFLVTRPDVDVTTFDGFVSAFKTYFVWLGGIFDKAGGITGEVVRTDWTTNLSNPGN